MKKVFAILVALVMLVGMVSAVAENKPGSGFEIPENTNFDEQAMNAYDKAYPEDSDVLWTAVLGKQVEDDINYAILCRNDKGFVISYIHEDADGACTVTCETPLAEMVPGLAGGWNMLDEAGLNPETLEQINNAFNGLLGIKADEVTVLGTQVVAGVNYKVLVKVTTVTAEPVSHWVLATVYVDLQGNASVTDMEDIDL